MDIIKAAGGLEPFEKEKYYRSLTRAGAPKALAQDIFSKVRPDIKVGMSTTDIHTKTVKALAEHDVALAVRYNLRRGLAALGPAGFLFEQFFESILRKDGYKTKRDVYLRGTCLSHEIDVLAERGNEVYLIELKYHNQHHTKTHVDVVMYAYAKLLDIAPVLSAKNASRHARYRMWLVTNTKFTQSAITYAKCQGIRLTGWSYPKGESLEDLVVRHNLYPVSVLPSMSHDILTRFAEADIMLLSDLCTITPVDLVKKVGISERLADRLYREANHCTGFK